ncbi:MAG: XrtA-associated ATPase [Desulfobulbaceae bacterium]|nr:XrtA-associated ATPase [Desulfobulbaceae bacterium]HIJ91211.1 AAA family ATPase [Deltaproteobacteria bacterium]
MYEKFYGFKEKPFHLVPNPNFLYLSKKHQNALTYLEYGLSEGSGFILLTGDIGAGKTTIIRHILNRIEDNIEVGVIFNTNVNSGELIDLVLHEFELESTYDNKAKSLDAIFQYLIKKYSQGKRVLLIIDEAQNLSTQALEEIRMLSNLQTDDQMLLQIMLVGQPELKRKLHSAALIQLSQRIAVSYHLGALEPDEIKEYVTFRLEKANGSPEIFEEDTFAPIYQASGGIPRIINLLCDTALVYGYGESLKRINTDVISQVILDKGGLGLAVHEQPAGEQPLAGQEQSDDNNSSRLLALEEKVASLQQQIDWRLAEISRNGAPSNDRLVAELRELLTIERKKTDKLLLEYGKLKVGLAVRAKNENEDEGGAAAKAKEAVERSPSSGLSQALGDDDGATQEVESSESANNWFRRILHVLS